LQVSRALLALPREGNITFWRGRPSTYLIPLLFSKMLGKKAILFVEGRGSALVPGIYRGPAGAGWVLTHVYKLIEEISYSIADIISVNVPGLLSYFEEKYSKKVFPFPISDHFIHQNFHELRLRTQNKTTIGYVGRLSREKGIHELIRTIPSICEKIPAAEFLICGDGPLLQELQDTLSDLVREGKVRITGWVHYDDLPGYLNEMKLLVLPSHYEGLPHTMIEAMACGTPVLATAVGAIPDIIVDSETGFTMEDNSPARIAQHIMRALNHPGLAEISEKARRFAESNYSYDAMVYRYSMLLTQVAEK
jgi:glycosyltransferase involved in cell wall biosynthesis